MAADDLTSSKTISLNNRVEMPAVGLGTYRIRNSDVIMKVVDCALENGYRMFDTASVYGNEHHLRKAFETNLPKHGLEREDIFITTKLSPSEHGGSETTEKAYLKSLNALGLEYIDLYLIHFPGASKFAASDTKNSEMRQKTWQKLTEIYDDGRVKAIGVSNYTVRHLRELMSNNHGVVPAVNQVEWHPYYYQPELLQYCQKFDIVLQAYCSLGGTSACNKSLLEDLTVVKIARKLKVTCPQLLLRWALQHGLSVIPKSTTPDHIKENINLEFVISNEDMIALDALGENNIKYAWDPSNVA